MTFDILINVKVDKAHAEVVSDVITYANKKGIDSHGVIFLKTYIKRIREGKISLRPSINIKDNSAAISNIDADSCFGHYAGKLAMEAAIEKAYKTGLGLVFVRNATHYGAADYFTEMASSNQMIGFSTTNTMPLIAPTVGKEKVLGNNPLSFATPQIDSNAHVLDMACSVVAGGKLVLANQNNENIPLGWALDKDGNDTTNPNDGLEGGSLLPIATYKGYGLSLIMDILSGVLSSSGYGKHVGESNVGFIMGISQKLSIWMNTMND